MIKLTIKDGEFRKLIASYPKTVSRSAEIALDKTARAIRDEVKEEIRRVFEAPTPWTLSSLQITPTKAHNMRASVWFKDPERMHQHYLVPQVIGGPRQLKGFERVLGRKQYVPGGAAKIDRYGNVKVGQIWQILSVLKLADLHEGYTANITARSRKRNKKPRDYIYLPKQGRRPAGVWQQIKLFPANIIRPILMLGRTGRPVKPRLDFYGIASRVHAAKFQTLFLADLVKRLP